MIENSFLESGFSFTASKLLPYIITILIGLIVVFLLRKKLAFRNRILRIALKLFVIVIPFGIYFVFNPIYQGDFANNSESVKRDTSNQEITGDKLVVLTIPGCPYCRQAMERMLVLKERNPALDIEFIVCHTDSTATEFYKEISEDKINVRLASNAEAMAELADHRYPAFVLSESVGSLKKWSNDSFGVRALDEVESLVKE